MSAAHERALAVAVEQLHAEFGEHMLGILLAGSVAYGEVMATSDVDLHVVIDQPWRQRRNLVIEGVDVEIFLNPRHKISAEIMTGEAVTDMFARGRIVFDRDGTMAALQDEARHAADQARPIPLGDDLEWLRYIATDTLKDVYDLIEAGDPDVELAMADALDHTLRAYYALGGRRMPKPKYVMRDLRDREPALADVVRTIASTGAPARERWERLDALVDEVLAHVGGKVVTSETTRAKVEPGYVVAHIEGQELPDEDIVVPPPEPHRSIGRVLVFAFLGLGLFVVALGLMRSGAAALAPSLEGSIFTDNAWSTLGLGWLGACIVLSGSPVAASALTLFDGGSIDRVQSFTMLTGSRLGAAFVVLVAGAIYALRNRTGSGTRAPISIGILSLLVTMVIYIPGAVIGFFLLQRGAIDGLNIGTSPSIRSATDVVFGPITDLFRSFLPGWALFPVGVVVLLVGFWLIDKVMPSVGVEQAEHRPAAWYERKWTMFWLGCGVCVLTLSVSVSLTVLVPLVAKGYIRRANTLPYIMGANITTLADTLVAAILLGNLDAVRVVVAVTGSVSVLTVLVLAVAYPLVRKLCLDVASYTLRSRVRLAGFVLVLLLVPMVLIAV